MFTIVEKLPSGIFLIEEEHEVLGAIRLLLKAEDVQRRLDSIEKQKARALELLDAQAAPLDKLLTAMKKNRKKVKAMELVDLKSMGVRSATSDGLLRSSVPLTAALSEEPKKKKKGRK